MLGGVTTDASVVMHAATHAAAGKDHRYALACVENNNECTHCNLDSAPVALAPSKERWSYISIECGGVRTIRRRQNPAKQYPRTNT